ncbi:hypothetical protein BRADI_1g04215v3 [Brachypodium distachyon]|uniref:Uncharacterized protein n=1 Tax=Brachypodium distachyon TaxID=15368 RepID=A0A2K2DI20_BRADI|nr:hypothetical protein BRADI_1g04215v3 [Brachypodium distachyon]
MMCLVGGYTAAELDTAPPLGHGQRTAARYAELHEHHSWEDTLLHGSPCTPTSGCHCTAVRGTPRSPKQEAWPKWTSQGRREEILEVLPTNFECSFQKFYVKKTLKFLVISGKKFRVLSSSSHKF